MVIEQKYIDMLIKKDEQAFELIYQRTKKGVYSVAFSIVKSHQITEDLMQDVYMKMMKTIDQYQKNTNFYNWLLQMTKNTALDYYRKYSKQIHLDTEDFNQTFRSTENQPDEETKFNQIINVLDEEEKMIVFLKVVDEMKHKDIAKLLNKPIGTIQYIYNQAIKKMQGSEGLK
ncbi:MAG: RNA polymerase sigma factor [Acholeplasmataceae bacterium]|jgi:RNA polymerase sigma-70 factor (ECF subfamily)|nr:RNA polymerase sigma factor [Acholeplasmataceae bacterium]